MGGAAYGAQQYTGGAQIVGAQTQFGGYGAITQQVTETIVPEKSFTTVEKYVEIPEMVVRKQLVPEVVETIVERRVKQIIQEVPEIQIQQVVEEVFVPQIQEVIKTVARPVIETQTIIQQRPEFSYVEKFVQVVDIIKQVLRPTV